MMVIVRSPRGISDSEIVPLHWFDEPSTAVSCCVWPESARTLTARGRTGTVYRPNRGFKGEDAFSFSLNARAGAVRESSTIHVQAIIK